VGSFQRVLRGELPGKRWDEVPLCPGSEDEGWNDEGRESMASLFSPAQRELIGRFLLAVSEDTEL
jgi:hypothetical protein